MREQNSRLQQRLFSQLDTPKINIVKTERVSSQVGEQQISVQKKIETPSETQVKTPNLNSVKQQKQSIQTTTRVPKLDKVILFTALALLTLMLCNGDTMATPFPSWSHPITSRCAIGECLGYHLLNSSHIPIFESKILTVLHVLSNFSNKNKFPKITNFEFVFSNNCSNFVSNFSFDLFSQVLQFSTAKRNRKKVFDIAKFQT